MTPSVIAVLAVVVLPLVLLVGDLLFRRGGHAAGPTAASQGAPVYAAPAPVEREQLGTIKPGDGMVYRGPVVARR